jgi:very-short-patch-repair endonuclease
MKNEIISNKIRDKLILQAREFRKHPTLAEAILWKQFRKRQVGELKFRRQHIIHQFIVDFYCPAAKLIIEIDGPIHQNQANFDAERENIICRTGYHVIRFSNQEVIQNKDMVVSSIYDSCMSRIESIKENTKKKLK